MTAAPVRISDYDVVLVNSSAGKDSQAMLDYVCELASASNVLGRVVVVHADLGRVEWQGTRDLAERQALHYGVRFEVTTRPQGDLLEHVAQRRMWPDSKNRYCTSDHKRGQVAKVMTKLAREIWDGAGEVPYPASAARPVHILNCMGLRRDESPKRAKMLPFARNARASNGRRLVDDWLPIHEWTVDQVWARIKASGVEHHRAYDLGMPRLSCCFCVFAPRAALVIAGRHNPQLLDEYIAVERSIGHTFRHGLSIETVRDAIRSGEPAVVSEADAACWRM